MWKYFSKKTFPESLIFKKINRKLKKEQKLSIVF